MDKSSRSSWKSQRFSMCGISRASHTDCTVIDVGLVRGPNIAATPFFNSPHTIKEKKNKKDARANSFSQSLLLKVWREEE